MKRIILFSTLMLIGVEALTAQIKLPEDKKDLKLVWSDEFDYKDRDFDKAWSFQNGPSYHILCGRYRENLEVKDGYLYIHNRKEKRGGQEWTSGHASTRKKFMYGYYECRYRYSEAGATNNSFWLTHTQLPKEGLRYEIDINEGHYPNEVNTNIHNKIKEPSIPYSKSYTFGREPGYSYHLELPVTATKVRLQSKNKNIVHIGEVRIYNDNNRVGYPDPLSKSADSDIDGLINYAKDAKITTSGVFEKQPGNTGKNSVDGSLFSRWTSQLEGDKWIMFEFDEPKRIGCVQFTNGWWDKTNWLSLILDYKIEYFDGKEWKDIVVQNEENMAQNMGKNFHTYGLLWSKDELVFYFEGKEIRREKNEFCWSESPILLSCAIIPWSGPVTDAIDGTSMIVDYVRVYETDDVKVMLY